VTVQIFV